MISTARSTSNMLLLLLLSGANASGQAATLAEHRVNIPERGEVIGYMVTVETNRFCFLPPPEWRVSGKPGARSVVMIAADLSTSIAVEFVDAQKSDQTVPASAQELLSVRYPDSQVKETFACQTGLGEGMAFDINRKGANKIRMTSRVVYVTQDSGVIEFTLTSPAAKFSDYTTTFANVVNSFHRPSR